MTQEIWFRANDDGRELLCDADSTVAKFMAAHPLFVRIDGPQGEELAQEYQGREPVIVDLSYMTEEERIELAKTILGLD